LPCFATVYSIFYILDLRQKYPHGYNKNGELEDYVTTDAYIVRDETVINSPSDGISIRNVEEGEKVGVGDTIATVLNKSSEKLLEDLKTLDLRIIEAKREKTKNDNFFSEDIKSLTRKYRKSWCL